MPSGWRWLALAGAVLAALGAALVVSVLIPRPALLTHGRQVQIEGREHVEAGVPIVYHSQPPTSGPHYPRTLRYGVFEREAEPGYWVHTLEHGGIVVLYNCVQPCWAVVQQLRTLYKSAPRSERWGVIKLAAVPYAAMQHRIAAIAWGWIDEMDEVDQDRILAFYREHVDRGPEEAP